jgi:signal peptidase I
LKFPPDKKPGPPGTGRLVPPYGYIPKRIIGLPGDEVELRGMELYVNGTRWTAQETPHPEDQKLESAGKDIIAFYEKSWLRSRLFRTRIRER